ncbi:O-antigen/teichoic acid export membrane protein [Hydrogenispora ethanolica]|uniref:O-antigen/teichoic acid export membrane protein n=2 Tax=Hydrogenispora ethanolica TaxID=1082276 RepID=A0A4R1SBH2_HYDET|nr:O-antigen/teichoic acid export membrane protein [Hydrogenispora ethanolica]
MENWGGMFKKSLVYLGSSLLVQILNLFLIPIYTRNFTPGQFGEFTLVTSFQSICTALTGLGIFSGYSRFYYESAEPQRLKNTALTFGIFWGVLNILIILAAAGPLSARVFGSNPHGPEFIGLSAVNALLASLISIYSADMTMRYQAWRSSLVTLANLLLAVVLTFCFLTLLHGGIPGAVRAQTVASGTVLGALLLGDIKHFRPVLDRPGLARMLAYGLGLLPGQIGGWALTLLDRYLMKDLVNLSAVGVYSMGYKIGMLIQPLLLNPFKNIFTPYKFAIYREADGRQRLRRIYAYYNFTGWWVVLGLALFADPALRILTTRAYLAAFTVVPLIATGYFLWSLAEFYSLGLHVANRTMLDSLIVIGGALLNIGLNLLFIPRWGMHGAAAAALGAYLGMSGTYFWAGQRYYRIGIRFWEPAKYCALATVIYLGYRYAKMSCGGLGPELLWGAGLWLSYGWAGYWLGLVPAEATRVLREQLWRGRRHCGQMGHKVLGWLGVSGK